MNKKDLTTDWLDKNCESSLGCSSDKFGCENCNKWYCIDSLKYKCGDYEVRVK